MGSNTFDYRRKMMALTEKMYFTPILLGPKKRPKRRYDLEFAHKSPGDGSDGTHTAGLVRWLKTLSVTGRYQVMSEKNPWLVTMLRQMYVRKVKEGDGGFTLIQDQTRPFESPLLDDYFKFERVPCEAGFSLTYSTVTQTERLLEQQLRLCDSLEYLDTLTVCEELVLDVDRFVKVMTDVSGGQAFLHPCGVSWHSPSKSWLWSTPSWNTCTNEPLVIWAASALERSLWTHYFQSSHLDPRLPTESQPYAWDPTPSEGYLIDRNELIDHWKDLGSTQKKGVLPGLEELNSLFQKEKRNWMKNTHTQYGFPQPAFATLTGSFSSTLMGAFGGGTGTYYTACRARMQCYQSEKSMEVLLTAAEERPTEFVDFLCQSPLERAGSIMDSVTRILAARLNSSYQQKLVDDLISTDIPPKPAPNRRSKLQKTAQNSEKVVKNREEIEEIEGNMREIVMEIVENVKIEPVLEEKSEELEGFQVVSTRKKTKKIDKKPEKETKKHKKKTKKKKKVEKSSKTADFSQSPITVKAVFWSENSISVSIPVASSEQFPPLSQESPSFSSLHYEIEAFEREMLQLAASKLTVREQVVGVIREIVGGRFEGAEVELIGSQETGLALPTSDVDVVVLWEGLRSREAVQMAVLTLSSLLLPCEWTASLQALDSASVPLIKLHVYSQFFSPLPPFLLKVDISFDFFHSAASSPPLGLSSSHYTKELLQKDPRLRCIILVIKQLLANNGLNSAYTGGLSSYSIVLWVAAYLHIDFSSDLGTLLKAVLRFYGEEFNPETTGIDMRRQGV